MKAERRKEGRMEEASPGPAGSSAPQWWNQPRLCCARPGAQYQHARAESKAPGGLSSGWGLVWGTSHRKSGEVLWLAVEPKTNSEALEKQTKRYSWFPHCHRYCLECVIQVTWFSCSVFSHSMGHMVGTAESKRSAGVLLGSSPSTVPLSSPGGCWQPAGEGLGAKRALSATAALETRSSKRLDWGHCHPSKD